MADESWPVKRLDGAEWGRVKKILINPRTRKISHVDVLLTGTRQLVRVAWEHFEVMEEAIFLTDENPPIAADLSLVKQAVAEPTRVELATEDRWSF
jgi:hypothetical protein